MKKPNEQYIKTDQKAYADSSMDNNEIDNRTKTMGKGDVGGMDTVEPVGDQNDTNRKINQNNDGYHQPVTWLPAVVVNQENNSTSFVLDQPNDNRASNDLLSHGAFVQLPPSYSCNTNNKIYGLMLGPDTVVPLDSLSIVNFHSDYGKLSNSTNIGQNENQDIGDEIQNLVKVDGDVSNQGVGDAYSGMQHDGATKEQLYCIYCHKFFKSLNELQTHMMLEHSEQAHMSGFMGDACVMHPSLRTCPSCGHQLRKVGTLDPDYTLGGHEDDQALQMTQPPNILMVCDNCGKEFTLGLAPEVQPSQVQAAQEAPKRHFCEHCEKSYKHNRDLRKHLRTHHGYENTSQMSVQSTDNTYGNQSGGQPAYQDPPPQTAKMVCQQCKKMFRGPFELRRHIHTVHENKRPYKCPECSKLFRDAYELKRHSASHQRVHYHSVAAANSTLEQSQSMDLMHLQNLNASQVEHNQGAPGGSAHMVSGSLLRDVYNPAHQQPGLFPTQQGSLDYYCSTCEKNFRGANEFKRHYSVVHEKKYRYKCIHCGKLWRDQYDLKRHCRRSHFVDRDIDRAFIRQCLLDNNADTGVNVQTPITISNYDMGQPVTLTLNHEAAAAIFGNPNENELRSSTNQLDTGYSIVDHSELPINRSSIPSPTDGMFQNITAIQSASMLYHSEDPTNLVENMMNNPVNETINEDNKNDVDWTNFDNDIQSNK